MTERPICDGCEQEIDPDCCWCGGDREGHNWDNHHFIPMGCECYRDRDEPLYAALCNEEKP